MKRFFLAPARNPEVSIAPSMLWVMILILLPTPRQAASEVWEGRWPEFRGPTCDGIAPPSSHPPLRWSTTENVRWKLPTEGSGWSTPAVWDGTAWFTAATDDGREMWAEAVDLVTGQRRWKQPLFTHEKVDEKHVMNSYASPSPVTDGERVWVHFGSYGTACLDAETGRVLWTRRDLPCNHWRGPGSSPILVGKQLIVHLDGFDYQYVVALDTETGATSWKVDRAIEYGTDNGDFYKAFSTPLLIDVDGSPQLISPTSKAVLAYNPQDGAEIWRVRFDEFSATARPLWDGARVYINTGFGKAQLLAIDPRGQGDLTATHVAWINSNSIGSKSSQLIHDGRIYNAHDAGVATCIDAASGETLWSQRLGGQFSASLMMAGGHLYFFDHDGLCHVIKPGPTCEVVSENRLDDGCMASPVPLGDSLLVRTRSAIYLLAGGEGEGQGAREEEFQSELLFPLDTQHNHAPGIVQFPSGDLLVSWYRGSGERRADDVAIFGAWKIAGQDQWSPPILLADQPGFPDCNTCLFLDPQQRLWLFWPTVIANSWESCLTRYRMATAFDPQHGPLWERDGLVLLAPDDFSQEVNEEIDRQRPLLDGLLDRATAESLDEEIAQLRRRLGDKLYQRLGWQPRCKPTLLPSGRILLPLYSDTFSISIMAISDDQGKTWFASKPLVGLGNIQPSVVRRSDGTLVAYMRENGISGRIRICESTDQGNTWGPVFSSSLPNPGSGLDIVRLTDGRWVIAYNDTAKGRSSLALSISADEGKTWTKTRHLEQQAEGSFHYPAIIEGHDRRIHVVYSYAVPGGESMKHASVHPDWIDP